MTDKNSIFMLLEHGGLVMYIIIALSVYVTAVIIYKSYQFINVKSLHPIFIEQINYKNNLTSITDQLRKENIKAIPTARIILTTINNLLVKKISKESATKETRRLVEQQITKLESHMRGLELISNIAPLLGLLGTVIGMVSAFATLSSQAGAGFDASLLAGGIWTALLTTVAGLCVAIPAITAHYIFDNKIESIRLSMSDVFTRILTAIEIQEKRKQGKNTNGQPIQINSLKSTVF